MIDLFIALIFFSCFVFMMYKYIKEKQISTNNNSTTERNSNIKKFSALRYLLGFMLIFFIFNLLLVLGIGNLENSGFLNSEAPAFVNIIELISISTFLIISVMKFLGKKINKLLTVICWSAFFIFVFSFIFSLFTG